MPSQSVPHSSFTLCLLLRSSPAKHRRPMKAFNSVLSVNFASLSWLKLGWTLRIYWFVCSKILSEISFVMRPLHASKGVVAFLARPITPGNFVRIFWHLRRVCVRTFYLTPLHLVLSNETTVTSVHFIAESSSDVASSAHSGVTCSRFHISSIGLCSVINAVIITTPDIVIARIR